MPVIESASATLHTSIGNLAIPMFVISEDLTSGNARTNLRSFLVNNLSNPNLFKGSFQSNELFMINKGVSIAQSSFSVYHPTLNLQVRIASEDISLTSPYKSAGYTSLYKNNSSVRGLFYGIYDEPRPTSTSAAGFTYFITACNKDPLTGEISAAELFTIKLFEASAGTGLISHSPASPSTSLSPGATFDNPGNIDYMQGTITFYSSGGGDDPYAEGGTSETGGGTGSWDRPTYPILRPGLPDIGEFISETNFITIYNPNIDQINSLASYMWSSDFIDRIRKLLSDPMEAIIALNILPIEIDNTNDVYVNVSLGNITTNVLMPVVEDQFVEVDCGELDIEEYYGSYLDYSPFTKIEIFLPYIGIKQLKADEVMNKTIHLVYSIDILSGACCAYIEVDGTVLYQFPGQCAYPVPLTSQTYNNAIRGTLGALVSVGTAIGTIVSGGSAGMVVGSLGSALISNVMGEKENIERTGSMGGCIGFMGGQTPYLIFTQPRQCVAENQNKHTGYPSYITYKLSDLEGFTTLEYIHLEGMSCTDAEEDEIYRLLKEGVIL